MPYWATTVITVFHLLFLLVVSFFYMTKPKEEMAMTILALIHPPTRGMLRVRHHWVSVTVACLGKLKRGYNRGMGNVRNLALEATAHSGRMGPGP